ncbi:MAG: lycopene cyclase family protein, partial [Bacteroidota bacterium]
LDSYEILHQEFGIIPMTDYPFKTFKGARIVNMGTAGGQVKPSSGYTFVRIQERADLIVRAIEQQRLSQLPSRGQGWRYRLYDSILLNVMLKNRIPISDVFTDLFKKNKPSQVLHFLDEKTSFFEEFFIMNSCPKIPFLKGFAHEMKKRLFFSNTV